MRTKDQILLEQAYQKIYEANEDYVIDINLSPKRSPENFRAIKSFKEGSSGIGGDSRQMASVLFNKEVQASDKEMSEIQEYGIPDSGENAGYSNLDEGGYEIRFRKGQEIFRHLALSLDNGITVKGWNDKEDVASWADRLGIANFRR